jgi:glutathione S-transferase
VSTALRPVLVLALDGATFDVIQPLAEAGELPHLAAWMKAGRAARAARARRRPSRFPPGRRS